jgi:arsenate reductase
LGEALINHLGAGRWRGFSAGSKPVGRVNPYALATLARHGIALPEARSKSWDEFALPDAPKMDFVVTVCDSAANEPCPVWPGVPMRAHWGLPDPAAAPDDAALTAAFESAYQLIHARVSAMMRIDFDDPDQDAIRAELKRIASIGA